MDQTTPAQAKGQAKANFVRLLPHDPRFAKLSDAERARNNRLPLFRGTISAPEAPDQLFEFAVWDYVRDGKTFYAGPVRPLSTRAGVEDHLAAAKLSVEDAHNMARADDAGERSNTLTPHSLIIRTNNAKVRKDAPQFALLPDADREANDRRPLYWLKWQREAGAVEVRGSLWDKAGRYGPFLDGNTQYPLSRAEAQEQASAPERDAEPVQEPVASGRKRDKSRDRGR